MRFFQDNRRVAASRLAKLHKIPSIIKNLQDDDAIIFLVDSNLHREELLPSEKAFAYKLKLDAMKRQGKRTMKFLHKTKIMKTIYLHEIKNVATKMTLTHQRICS